jgi:uncharacterized membrane protein
MERERYHRDTSGYDRALGFFDVIYGFSLTLLIANLDVPPPEAWQSLQHLLSHDVGGQLLGFLISFIVIATFWRTNHALINRLSSLSPAVISANILAAGLVLFIPFSTQGMSDPHTSDLPLPNVVYAVNIAAVMLVQSSVLVLAHRDGLIARPLGGRRLQLQVANALVAPVVFLASIPIAYTWGGDAAKYFWLVLVILGPLSARLVQRAERALTDPSPADPRSSTPSDPPA